MLLSRPTDQLQGRHQMSMTHAERLAYGERHHYPIMTTANLLAHGYADVASARTMTHATEAAQQSEREACDRIESIARAVANRGHVGEALTLMTYARVALTWPVTGWGSVRHPCGESVPVAMPLDYDIMTGLCDGVKRPIRRAAR